MRSVISKFRLKSHTLQVQKGRHSKPKTPLEDRLCIQCNQGAIENEKLLLFACRLYNDIHAPFIRLCYEKLGLPSMDSLSIEETIRLFMNHCALIDLDIVTISQKNNVVI